MKKKMMPGVHVAALAVVSVAALMGAQSWAQAQAFIEVRPWAAPRYHSAPPVEVYRGAPPFAYEADYIPRAAVRRIVERRGFEVIGPIRLTGDVYIVPVEDPRGRVQRLVVDARDGEIVERVGSLGPPRPPANVGRPGERYAVAPRGSDLPPLPVAPRGGWRQLEQGAPVPPPAASERERIIREEYARQSPETFDAPRGRAEGFDFVPETAAPAPNARAAEPRRAAPAQQQRNARTTPEAKPKQQAARTPPAARPSAETPSQKSQAASKPAAERSAAAKPAAPKPVAATPPAAEAEPPKAAAVKPAAAPREVAKPAATEKPEPAAAPAETVAARTQTPEPAASKPTASKPAASKPAASKPVASAPAPANWNSSILRRPAQKEAAATEGPRRGVAEAPTISSGAEPQRQAPRVVYPGPGAPAQPPVASE